MTRILLMLFVGLSISGCVSTGGKSVVADSPSLKVGSTQVLFGRLDPSRWLVFSQSERLGMAMCRAPVCGQSIAVVYTANPVPEQQSHDALIVRVREELNKSKRVQGTADPERKIVKGYPAVEVTFTNHSGGSASQGHFLIIGAGTAEILIFVAARDMATAKKALQEFTETLVVASGG